MQKRELCVVYHQARRSWNWLFHENGKRRGKTLGSIDQLPTRELALRRAHELKRQQEREHPLLTVARVAEEYRNSVSFREKRADTQRTYDTWLDYVVTKWGEKALTELRSKPIEEWLRSLEYAPRTKASIRSAISRLWDYAMWAEHIISQINPMSKVTIPGVTDSVRPAVNLTVEQFEAWIFYLLQPFRTIALVSLGCGLRISEALALKWSDIDWLQSRISVERSIVYQVVDHVKTRRSKKRIHASPAVLGALEAWRKQTRFAGAEDWVFASAAKLGRQPWAYESVRRAYHGAALKIGLERMGTHSMRHTCRSWLDAVATKPTVTRDAMRHTSLTMTFGVYGAVVTDEERLAFDKLSSLIDTAMIPDPANSLKTQ